MKLPVMNATFFNSVKGDKVIWSIVLTLLFMSILLIYSAMPISSKGVLYSLVEQVGFVSLGLFLMYTCHKMPLGYYRRLAGMALLFSLVLLIITPFFPNAESIRTGAYRWIDVPILGLSLQTSDAAKIALVIYLAKALEDGGFNTFKDFFVRILLPIGLVCLLIYRYNASTAILIGAVSFCIILISGVRSKYVVCTLGVIFAGLVLIVLVDKAYPGVIFKRNSTVDGRIGRFFNAQQEEKNYQIEYAKTAAASGGILGRGPGNSTQRLLPMASSDFVYAVVLEEYGLIGGIAFVMMYLWLLFRAIVIARKCTLKFSAIVVLGLMLLIVFQAVVNMGVAVNILPVTGQTLPLVSKGGTSLVFMSIAFGIVLAVSRAVEDKDSEDAMIETKTESVAN